MWDSFWSAWDAFAGADSYQQTIERAVAYGNDTDTTAAIAGGLAGIYWGIDGIPAEWLAGMRGRDVVAPLVDRLLATAGWRTSTTNPIRVNWVDLTSVPGLRGAAAAGGRLGMTFLPGKQRDGWSGLHWRDLEADARVMRNDHCVDTLLLLVEDHELEAARVPSLAEAMTVKASSCSGFPIEDMEVTTDRDGLRRTLDDVLDSPPGREVRRRRVPRRPWPDRHDRRMPAPRRRSRWRRSDRPDARRKNDDRARHPGGLCGGLGVAGQRGSPA